MAATAEEDRRVAQSRQVVLLSENLEKATLCLTRGIS